MTNATLASRVRDFITGRKLRVVIYARVSRDRNGREISVKSQIVIGKRWAKRNGAQIVAILCDNDISGRGHSTDERVAYKEALRLIESGVANTLWTWESARAQRDMPVFIILRELLELVGGFWAYDERILDMSDPDDRMQATRDALRAEEESIQIGKRSRRGILTRALDGYWAGPISFGYRCEYNSRTGEVRGRKKDKELAAVFVEMAERALASESESSIARDLRNRGIPCARGDRWNQSHIKRIHFYYQDARQWAQFLDTLNVDQVHSAYAVANGLRRRDPYKYLAQQMNRQQRAHCFPGQWCSIKVRSVLLNPFPAGLRVHQGQVIGKGRWPKLISKETHLALVARLRRPGKSDNRDGDRVKHLLSGRIMACDVCGSETDCAVRSGAETYRCKKGCVQRRKHMVEPFVVETLLQRLEAPDAAQFFAVADDGQVLPKLHRAAKKCRDKLDAARLSAASPDGISMESLAVMEHKLKPEIARLEEQIMRLGAAPLVGKVMGPQAREVWETLTLPQKREIIAATLRPKLRKGRPGRQTFDPKGVVLKWIKPDDSLPDIDTVLGEKGACLVKAKPKRKKKARVVKEPAELVAA